MAKKVEKTRVDEILKVLGLENRKNNLPNELSGGQQQRVSIGRALINNPAIILADEPTGNLDSKSSDEIVELLKVSNKKYNQTIIMITHNLEIAKIADRVIKIEDGKNSIGGVNMNVLNKLTLKSLQNEQKKNNCYYNWYYFSNITSNCSNYYGSKF